MKIFTSTLYKILVVGLFLWSITGLAQQSKDSIMNMDAAFNRPYLTSEKSPVSLGGYLEANTIHSTNDEGDTDGLSFQARRLTLFVSASISKRIKFMTEIEFEDGGDEVEIEFASMDVAFHPLVNLRGGIVMNPIGAFNENHDGPKWEFVERPNVATELLGATLSNAGFGLHGKTYHKNWIFGYEAYLTNGFNNTIISNDKDKTYLPAGKADSDRFMSNASGKAMFTGKIAIKNRHLGEVGFSYMGGTYNQHIDDGEDIEDPADVNVYAIDLHTEIPRWGTQIIGEIAWVNVQIPDTYTQQYGRKQMGMFVDVVQPVYRNTILDWENATVNLAARLDYVDWNVGRFNETGTRIGDEVLAITPAISFRPTPRTVFRVNYRYEWETDIMNNPPGHEATWYFGVSTYF